MLYRLLKKKPNKHITEKKKNLSSFALQYMHAARLTSTKIPKNCKKTNDVYTFPLCFIIQQNMYDKGYSYTFPSSHKQPSARPMGILFPLSQWVNPTPPLLGTTAVLRCLRSPRAHTSCRPKSRPTPFPNSLLAP